MAEGTQVGQSESVPHDKDHESCPMVVWTAPVGDPVLPAERPDLSGRLAEDHPVVGQLIRARRKVTRSGPVRKGTEVRPAGPVRSFPDRETLIGG